MELKTFTSEEQSLSTSDEGRTINESDLSRSKENKGLTQEQFEVILTEYVTRVEAAWRQRNLSLLEKFETLIATIRNEVLNGTLTQEGIANRIDSMAINFNSKLGSLSSNNENDNFDLSAQEILKGVQMDERLTSEEKTYLADELKRHIARAHNFKF